MARTSKNTTTKKNLLTMPTQASAAVTPTNADVAKRAFELYCQRGCQDGFDMQDWLQAEREMLGATHFSAA